MRRAFIVFDLINPHGVKQGTAHIDVAAIESYATASGVHGGTIVRTTSGGVFHVDMTPDEIAVKLIEAWRVMTHSRSAQ